jgi:hypothetical protein
MDVIKNIQKLQIILMSDIFVAIRTSLYFSKVNFNKTYILILLRE